MVDITFCYNKSRRRLEVTAQLNNNNNDCSTGAGRMTLEDKLATLIEGSLGVNRQYWVQGEKTDGEG